ncbi:MAG: TldD/PmbA family protein, partial [Spirochaetaceae bacterium]|nr:TldD/PmbA family protein [Spirochaetaceae bacterium]
MADCAPSAFLRASAESLAEAVRRLESKYEFVSILGTDDSGLSFRATPGETIASEPFWVQRGFVARAQRGGRIVEYAFNRLSDGDTPSAGLALADKIAAAVEPLFDADPGARAYAPLADEAAKDELRGQVEQDAFAAFPGEILSRLAACRDKLLEAEGIASAQARADFVRVSRIFMTPHRSLFQTFDWSQAYAFGVARKGNIAKNSYRARSGLLGLEILDMLEKDIPELAGELLELLRAQRISPGVYDVILDPDVAGTLAHEAFGHGVEADMFVKGRARAAEYVGKSVASGMVDMFDGAAGVSQTGSFLFDDEGNLARKTVVIEKGILRSTIADALSAQVLGMAPTGNGRRQAYDHKAYARMTNTYFAPGESTFEEILASTESGWLLERLDSGMEDPRNWGIQLVALVGREIKGGKFT